MPFGARNDEGWRLCLRKGKTIVFVYENVFPDIIVEFPSQARAKACADELNEIWDPYWKTERKQALPDYDVFNKYIDILVKHNGIAPEDRQHIKAHMDGTLYCK
jgi:hypothetical protein